MTKTQNNTPRADLYTRITDRIIAELEQGVRPWFKPWNAGNTEGRITRPLRHTGEAYSGINVLLLWCEAVTRGFTSPTWMTFKQALEFGACVRKGETGSMVVYAGRITRTGTDEKGEDSEREIPFLKSYTVFNVEQIDGLPERFFHVPAAPVANPIERIQHAEAFFAACGSTIRHGGGSAHYSPALDYVQMPPFEAFTDAESYYSTLAHEHVHWTKHPTRLDREFGRKRFGDEGYAREELVAELGSAFLAADLNLTPEPREDHAAYIASWLEVLRSDKRCILQSAAYAQRACDFLHGLQPHAATPEADTPSDEEGDRTAARAA